MKREKTNGVNEIDSGMKLFKSNMGQHGLNYIQNASIKSAYNCCPAVTVTFFLKYTREKRKQKATGYTACYKKNKCHSRICDCTTKQNRMRIR